MNRGLVQQLLVAIEVGVIFTIPPHAEGWEDGLRSLDEVRTQIGEVKVRLQYMADTPAWLLEDLESIQGKLNDFVRFRDDFYRNFPSGGLSGTWAARPSAERALTQLQHEVAALKHNIRVKAGRVGQDRTQTIHTAEKVAVFGFGIVFVVTMLVIAINYDEPTRFQYEVFKVVLALAAAGFAAMIPGLLGVDIPGVKAGGALAVFVLVMYKSPADFVATPPPKPVRGSVILDDGFHSYRSSGFLFSSGSVVAWDSRVADILAARQQNASKTGFFLPYDSTPYRSAELDRQATAGIQKVNAASFDDVQQCPTSGYAYHWFQPEANAFYCVRLRSGKAFALIRIAALDDDRIGIEYLYQPSGSNRF